MLMEWNGSLEVGCKQIDDEHKHLLILANTLYDAIMARKRDPRAVLAHLRAFTGYLHLHFAHEEQLMRETGYPGLEAHTAEHAAFAREVDTLVAGSGVRTDYLDTVVSVVFRLMAGHRDSADAELALFLTRR
ncbi:MAG: bacteriohemerythrin [Rhodospirillaceae bacterium]